MANYYLNMSYGKVGKGIPHINYILGEEKYNYKENEIAYTYNHIPKWANDAKDFWKAADELEYKSTARVYKEVKISLPNELTMDNNIELVNEFLKKELGENHYYSVAIHEKEVNEFDGKISNPHAHIMICTRELTDNITFTRDTFFNNPLKKFNPGCKKNREWDKKEKLIDLRKSWENIQNKHLEKNGCRERVSADSLKKQREEALKNGNIELAKYLDRPAINISGRILQKSEERLTTYEKRQKKQHQKSIEIRDLSQEVYQMELEEKKLRNTLHNIKEIDGTLNVAVDNMYVKENISESFEKVFNMSKNIEDISFDLLKATYILKNDLDNMVYNSINPNYSNLKVQLDKAIISNDIDNQLLIDKQISEIENSITDSDFNLKKSIMQKQYMSEIEDISSIKRNMENNFSQLEATTLSKNNIQYEEYLKLQLKNNFNQNFDKYMEFTTRISKIESQLEKIKIGNTPENINKTAINIVTKGEFKRLENQVQNNKFTIDRLQNHINHKVFNDQEEKTAIKQIEKLKKENNTYELKLDDFRSSFKTPKRKDKIIRIEESVKNNYREKEPKLLQELHEATINRSLYKNTLFDKTETKQHIYNYINKQTELRSINYLQQEKLSKSLDNFNKMMSEKNIEMLAYNKLTDGKYLKLINEFKNLEKETQKLEVNLKVLLDGSLVSKIKNRDEIKNLKEIIEKNKSTLTNIDKEFYALKDGVNSSSLSQEKNKIMDIKISSVNKINKDIKILVSENKYISEKIKEARDISKSLPTLDKQIKNYRRNLLQSLDNKNIDSFSAGVIYKIEDERHKKNDFEISFN